MALIVFLDVFILILCFFILRALIYNNVGLPRNLPVVGMLPQLLVNVHRIHDFCTDILERSHCTFLLRGPWFTNMDILITIDPAKIRYIMSSNFSNFPKGTEFKQIFDVLGDGIFNSDLDLWKNQRNAAQALLNHERFYKFMVKTITAKLENGIISVLDGEAKQGVQLDLQDLFNRFTFDSTCILVTGYDPRCLSIDLPEVRFSNALEDAEESIFYRHVVPEKIWKLQRWLDIGQEHKLRKAKETLDEIIFEYIQRKREELSKGISKQDEKEGVDLLTSYIMMDASETIGLKSNDNDLFLRDTILSFLLAGRDTTSSALTWFFYLISKNPHVEAKIRDEIKSIVPETKQEKNWVVNNTDIQRLKELVYLNAAFFEALRLYPPLPFQHKSPLVTDKLPSGHDVILGKTKIVLPIYAMGRMKSIWGENCLEFEPERWISEKGTIKRQPSYKFFTFNAGPRTCLGKEVAFIQMRAVAASIIHNYKVEAVKEHPHYPNVSILLHMKHGFMVKLRSIRGDCD